MGIQRVTSDTFTLISESPAAIVNDVSDFLLTRTDHDAELKRAIESLRFYSETFLTKAAFNTGQLNEDDFKKFSPLLAQLERMALELGVSMQPVGPMIVLQITGPVDTDAFSGRLRVFSDGGVTSVGVRVTDFNGNIVSDYAHPVLLSDSAYAKLESLGWFRPAAVSSYYDNSDAAYLDSFNELIEAMKLTRNN